MDEFLDNDKFSEEEVLKTKMMYMAVIEKSLDDIEESVKEIKKKLDYYKANLDIDKKDEAELKIMTSSVINSIGSLNLIQYDADAIIWGRTAIGFGWAPNRIAIFGHTPTVSLPVYARVEKDEGRPVKFIGRPVLDDSMTGAKIDMDTGACFLGTAYVLNCLTMKAQGFETKNNQVKKIEVIQF